MPTNTPLPTVVTGGIISAATTNDTAVLNTAIGLFGAGPAIQGTKPPLTAPNWYIQAGSPSVVFTSGASTSISFPNPFPNTVLCFQALPILGSAVQLDLSLLSCSLSAFTLNAVDSSGPHTGTFSVSWFAIGA